jgi:cytochrome c peroxidase
LAFTDGVAFSQGVTGDFTPRSSMSLINAAFYTGGLFWDGRSMTLEDQALEPVENPIELHEDWVNVEEKLKRHADYPIMFREAFGIEDSDEITRDLAAKAISQFERIIISGWSKFDKFREGLAIFSDEERMGMDLFFDSNFLLPDAECAHCHNTPLFTTNEYFNNGLDSVEALDDFLDFGFGDVSGIYFDKGKFRAPTLRNIVLTAPYMHDGRFETLEEVIDHYNEGTHAADNTPEIIRDLELSEEQKQSLLAFLHTLTDTSYLSNEFVINPFK